MHLKGVTVDLAEHVDVLKRLTFIYCRCNDGYKRWSMLLGNVVVTVHLHEAD